MAKRNILVDPDRPDDQFLEMPINSSLVSWIVTRVKDWEDYRQTNFDNKWDEYYRLWRGFWEKKDSSRDSERSRLIAPALSQAIEATVAELEEATFGRGKWFDVSDNFTDEDKTDIAIFRDQMAEDFTKEGIEAAMSEIFLNGCLYGTGIGKVILNEVQEKTIVPTPIGDTQIAEPEVLVLNTVRVGLLPVHPKEFVIDPIARSIDEALGMAHITTVPRHKVLEKMAKGIYMDAPLTGFNDNIVGDRFQSERREGKGFDNIRDVDKVMLIEYHGMVPRELLEPTDEIEVDLFNETSIKTDEADLVEAIVTIANGNQLLRAVKNPFLKGDRAFVAYQHDIVPNRFWGRGVSEKGYNPQKALDAELRGRIDAMALSIHPMMAMDATRIHRGADFRVAPGRSLFTNGDPRDILMPFNFGQVNNNTFAQTGELERMVQMGTGAMDSATPLAENRRNETSSGMSMIMGGAMKRSKRTLSNIERDFTRPFINKAAWRYMQFAPERYPILDVQFNVHSTLGIMARELEQQQLSNLLNTVPPESPAFWMLLRSIYENSSISNREEMLVLIDVMMQDSLQKQAGPEEQDPLVALKQQELQLDAQVEQAKLAQKADNDNKELELELQKLRLQQEKLILDREEMLMDAKIELAKMEQDSLVTAAQMSEKARETQAKAQTESQPKSEGEKKQVININTAGGKKTVEVSRTSDGLRGTVEEVDG